MDRPGAASPLVHDLTSISSAAKMAVLDTRSESDRTQARPLGAEVCGVDLSLVYVASDPSAKLAWLERDVPEALA